MGVDGLKETVETVSEDTRKANMCHFLNMATSAGTDLLSQVTKFRRAKFLNIPPPEQTDYKVRVKIAKVSGNFAESRLSPLPSIRRARIDDVELLYMSKTMSNILEEEIKKIDDVEFLPMSQTMSDIFEES